MRSCDGSACCCRDRRVPRWMTSTADPAPERSDSVRSTIGRPRSTAERDTTHRHTKKTACFCRASMSASTLHTEKILVKSRRPITFNRVDEKFEKKGGGVAKVWFLITGNYDWPTYSTRDHVEISTGIKLLSGPSKSIRLISDRFTTLNAKFFTL